MKKTDLAESVGAVLRAEKVPQRAISRAIELILQKEPPKEKTSTTSKSVVVVFPYTVGATGEVRNVDEAQSFVLKVPEEIQDNKEEILQRISRVLAAFNEDQEIKANRARSSGRGRRNFPTVANLAEAVENVPSKYWRAEQIQRAAKAPCRNYTPTQ